MPAHIKSILDLADDVMSLVLRKLQMIRLHTQLKEYLHTHKISEGETCGIIKYAAPWQQVERNLMRRQAGHIKLGFIWDGYCSPLAEAAQPHTHSRRCRWV